MKTSLSILFVLAVILYIQACGSAETIKGYSYHTSKANLEKAVIKVIKSNPHIYPDDTTDAILDSINLSHKKNWTNMDSVYYYDNLNAYVRMAIKTNEAENYYVLRYLGGRHEWENNSTSEIFISEVYNNHGDTLSQGHNEHGEFKTKMAKDFTDLLEKEFINKVDEELNLKHTVQ